MWHFYPSIFDSCRKSSSVSACSGVRLASGVYFDQNSRFFFHRTFRSISASFSFYFSLHFFWNRQNFNPTEFISNWSFFSYTSIFSPIASASSSVPQRPVFIIPARTTAFKQRQMTNLHSLSPKRKAQFIWCYSPASSYWRVFNLRRKIISKSNSCTLYHTDTLGICCTLNIVLHTEHQGGLKWWPSDPLDV